MTFLPLVPYELLQPGHNLSPGSVDHGKDVLVPIAAERMHLNCGLWFSINGLLQF